MAKEGYQKVANKKDLPEGGLLKVEPDTIECTPDPTIELCPVSYYLYSRQIFLRKGAKFSEAQISLNLPDLDKRSNIRKWQLFSLRSSSRTFNADTPKANPTLL